MIDYKIGYGKPPRLKKGSPSPNPRGRPRKVAPDLGDLVDRALNAETKYREDGAIRKASGIKLVLMRYIADAIKGDVGSAAMLLRMRTEALKHGDTGGIIRIHITGGMQRPPPKADQKKQG
jgi:hypothetical protein